MGEKSRAHWQMDKMSKSLEKDLKRGRMLRDKIAAELEELTGMMPSETQIEIAMKAHMGKGEGLDESS